MIKAFLFDLNGTMIDDMPFHIKAWHQILNDLGATISLEETKHQCYGKNNDLLERVFPKRFSIKEMDTISIEKEQAYQKTYLPHLKLIDGLQHVLEAAKKQSIKMAIGSAAIMFNIDFVLDHLSIRHYFDAIISADDVTYSKPHGETYLKCAEVLGVLPHECIVFEDVPKGVESARNAGMKAVVLEGLHHKDEFGAFDNVIQFINDYTKLEMDAIL
jgi:beta-phosphoglucomutase